jgi:hypothetical protein
MCSEILSEKDEHLDEKLGDDDLANSSAKKQRTKQWPELEQALNNCFSLRKAM